MRLAEEEDVEKILDYLECDLGNCVYLYMDIKKYGLSNCNMRVWINEGEVLDAVIMKYYDSIQLHTTRKSRDISDILNCIEKEDVQMISGEKTVIDIICNYGFIKDSYDSKEGYIFLLENYRLLEDNRIEKASPGDCEEIARLICMDEEFSENYCEEILAEQLKERILTGMGRSYIIKKNSRIVAHIATFAEVAQIAVTSGLIVHPDYRDFPYGAIMESYLVNALKAEGFRIFTFVNDIKRVKLLKALGNTEYGQYKKLTRKRI